MLANLVITVKREFSLVLNCFGQIDKAVR